MEAVRFLGQTFDLNLGKITFSPSFLQAGAIIVLIFLLVLTMASFRRHMVGWSLKGGVFGLFIGFTLALILEGFLIVGGKTAVTELVGWKNAPKPLLVALEAGRSKLVAVLGVTDEIPTSNAEIRSTTEKVVTDYQSLNPVDAKAVRKMICIP